MDTPQDASDWPHARQTVMKLRAEFDAIGIPIEVVQRIIPRGDIGGGEHVILGTWDVDSADLLVAALAALREHTAPEPTP